MAVAEQLYDALTVWADQGSLEVTSTSLAFFQQFSSSITPGTYSSSSSQYSTLTSAIKSFADGFVAIHAEYTPSGGGLAEQYSKTDGTPVSAVDLTWSYAAALTGFAARSGSNTESWGAAGLSVPSTCSGNSGPTVEVTFNVDATTVFGGESSRSSANVLLGGWMDGLLRCIRDTENIYITGSIAALETWSPDNALLLSSADYPIWSSMCHLQIFFLS